MQHLLPVLWKTGKHQHGPGKLYRHTSHCSSAKGAVSLGMAYLAINPGHWIKLLGTRSLHVCVFLYGSARECVVRQKLCPLKELPFMLTFDAGWASRLQQIPRCRRLAVMVVLWLWLGLPRWWISKGQICARFSKAGLFLLICKPGGKTDTGYWLFCSVLFCFCITIWMILATEFVGLKTQGRSWQWQVAKVTIEWLKYFCKKTSKYRACELSDIL